jgi:hypothetical protein
VKSPQTTQAEQDTLVASVKLNPVHDDAVCFGHKPEVDSFGGVSAPRGCIVEVAADTQAMTEALAEFGFRMVIEHGATWESDFFILVGNAKVRAFAKLADEIKSKQGYTPPV